MPLSFTDVRLIERHIDTMTFDLLSDAYVGIAKASADFSDDERRVARRVLGRILDLMKEQGQEARERR